MSATLERIAQLAGATGPATAADGTPLVAPSSVEAAAAVLGEASRAGMRVRLEGRGTWMPADAPADLALTSRALDQVLDVAPDDLVATVGAGVPMDVLQAALGARATWVALDPPGRGARSLGSVIATGTAGPLRAGYGPVRDHLLGLTLVTGDGRVVEVGGRVVKNVAGYDLTRLQAGAFGGFGLVARVHLRLRALPAADRNMHLQGDRASLLAAGRALLAARISAAAAELSSSTRTGTDAWTLVVRLHGTEAAVAAESERVRAAAPGDWTLRDAGDAPAPPEDPAATGVRLGVPAPGLEQMMSLVDDTLGEAFASASLTHGGLRWQGHTTAAAIDALRVRAAEREVPLTVERAPWGVRHAAGHFGAWRSGVGPLVDRVRQQFDPAGTLVVPLEGGARE